MTEPTSPPGAAWRPLVTDPGERDRLLALAAEIAAAVATHAPNRFPDDLVDHAILRAYLGLDDGAEEDVGAAALSAAVTLMSTTPGGPALYGGACRVGWAVAHLADGDDAQAVGDAVERSVIALIERPGWAEYDLISGLVGFGLFALERGDARGPLAIRVLDHLERLATPRAGGLAWFSPPTLLPEWQRQVAPNGYWNLGLAHGMPGVIGLLARYVEAGVEPARARALLDAGVAHLLAAAPPHDGGRFVAWIPEGVPPDARSVRRVAWCYGDLGASVALLRAAQVTGDATWRAEALATARLAATCPSDAAGVQDMGLCHGAAGAAHVLNRLYQATGDEVFGDAARAWLARTVAMRRPEPIAGFPSASPEDGVMHWTPEAGLLIGAAGVALALHAACTEQEPGWDRLLLVDLPVG